MKVERVRFEHESESQIRKVRKLVFTDEQGVPVEMEFDGNDQQAIHVLAIDKNTAIGTGRILQDGHIGRMAVLKPYRGIGVGKKIVLLLVEEARKNKYPRVYLSAQKHALGFYEKVGFISYGNEYLEAGIEHLAMEMFLESIANT